MSDANPDLSAVFREALSHSDAAARAAYLDLACGHDADLRRQVEAMLAAENATDKPKVVGPEDPDATTAPEPSALNAEDGIGEGIGTFIAGRYTLLEAIGEGGMGSVYLAEQTEPVKRHVALKLIKTGMDSKSVLARFDAERQALAMMDHPNIARVYDGGTTPSGRPFFVMELVDAPESIALKLRRAVAMRRHAEATAPEK